MTLARATAALLVLSAAGCTLAPISQETVIAQYRQRCLAYGHSEGTTALAECVEREVRFERAAARDRLDRLDRSLAAMRPQPGVTCRPVAYGAVVCR